MPTPPDRIEVRNINPPHHVTHGDRTRCMAMRAAPLAALPDTGTDSGPDTGPGPTVADPQMALRPHLDSDLFNSGTKAGWWKKCVQLDLAARGIFARTPKSPVRPDRTGTPA